MDEAIVDDGAADLLVELEERLHLVHRDCFGSFNSQESQMKRHCEMEAEKPGEGEEKAWIQHRDSSARRASWRRLREVHPPAAARRRKGL